MTDELNFLTIAEAAAMLQGKRLSPVELTEAMLARIEALNPQLDAFVTLTADQARHAAKQAEADIAAGRYRGPMHGIPIGLKDIYYTRGIATTGHSRVMQHHVPDYDAHTTARLEAAGAVLLGKLSTHEFAHGGPSFDLPWPPARNPWNRDHFTGGSSSGSGAAVAAGFMLGALGSDTGGSIRNPASLCGLVGLKPTYGRVSRHGVIANSFTFDHAGPLTWSVEDCAIMTQAIAGYDPKDPASAKVPLPDLRAALSRDIKGLRIGVVRHFFEDDLPANAEMRAALEDAIEVFQSLGAVLQDVRLRPAQDYYDIKVTIAESELFSVHETCLRHSPGKLGADFRSRCLPACLIGASDYVQAQRKRRQVLAEMQPIYDQFDVLLTMGTYGPAPRFDTMRSISFWQRPSITTPFNVSGGPALVQCMGFSAHGLPLALQIAGRPFDEPTVLRAAHAYEQATPWRQRRPQLEPAAVISAEAPLMPEPEPAEISASHRDQVATVVRRAGLALCDEYFEQICVAAPYVEAMLGRVYGELEWSSEPANIFTFPGA